MKNYFREVQKKKVLSRFYTDTNISFLKITHTESILHFKYGDQICLLWPKCLSSLHAKSCNDETL